MPPGVPPSGFSYPTLIFYILVVVFGSLYLLWSQFLLLATAGYRLASITSLGLCQAVMPEQGQGWMSPVGTYRQHEQRNSIPAAASGKLRYNYHSPTLLLSLLTDRTGSHSPYSGSQAFHQCGFLGGLPDSTTPLHSRLIRLFTYSTSHYDRKVPVLSIRHLSDLFSSPPHVKTTQRRSRVINLGTILAWRLASTRRLPRSIANALYSMFQILLESRSLAQVRILPTGIQGQISYCQAQLSVR